MPDFEVQNHGTIFLIIPRTEDAKAFSVEAFADAEMFGNGYAVEHRYAYDIVTDLADQGFSLQ